MKRIVVCCDGTGQDEDVVLDKVNYTNVARLCDTIKPTDTSVSPPIVQMKLYMSGVGTGEAKITGRWKAAFGDGMMDKVKQGIDFIYHNWEFGDEIYLIGFSRGAYEARMIASVLGVIGILPEVDGLARVFQTMKKRSGPPESDAKTVAKLDALLELRAPAKKRQDAALAAAGKFLVKAVCVYDTVGTRGRPHEMRLKPKGQATYDNFGLQDHILFPHIEKAFQVLALDEARVDFAPVVWSQDEEMKPKGQTLLQTWVSGSHSGAGGGLAKYDLCTIGLNWMVAQTMGGLAYDFDLLKRINSQAQAPYGTLAPFNSRTGIYRAAAVFPREFPDEVDPTTNEHIHWSVLCQPTSHLRPEVAKVLQSRPPGLVLPLLPWEEEVRKTWPIRSDGSARVAPIPLPVSLHSVSVPSSASMPVAQSTTIVPPDVTVLPPHVSVVPPHPAIRPPQPSQTTRSTQVSSLDENVHSDSDKFEDSDTEHDDPDNEHLSPSPMAPAHPSMDPVRNQTTTRLTSRISEPIIPSTPNVDDVHSDSDSPIESDVEDDSDNGHTASSQPGNSSTSQSRVESDQSVFHPVARVNAGVHSLATYPTLTPMSTRFRHSAAAHESTSPQHEQI